MHTRTLNIYTYEIDIGIEFGQTNSIFALAATKFKYDGMVILEILFSPSSSHLKRYIVNDGIGILVYIGEGLHFCKFL